MFGYVNLMLIKFVDDEITCSRCVYMYTLCFHSKLMKYDVDELLMNSWLVIVVAVMRCCCRWLEPWVIIIIESWNKLVWFWKFYKNGSNGEFYWNDVLNLVLYGFESLFMFIYVWTNFGIKWGLRGFKIGILGWKMEFFPRFTCHNSPWRVIWSPGRVALWQYSLFRVLASFSHVCVSNWLLV